MNRVTNRVALAVLWLCIPIWAAMAGAVVGICEAYTWTRGAYALLHRDWSDAWRA